MMLLLCDAFVSARPIGVACCALASATNRERIALEAVSNRERRLSTGNRFESVCSRPEFDSRASARRRFIIESACSRSELASRSSCSRFDVASRAHAPETMSHGARTMRSTRPVLRDTAAGSGALVPPTHDGLLPWRAHGRKRSQRLSTDPDNSWPRLLSAGTRRPSLVPLLLR